jgi:hypothetical protein
MASYRNTRQMAEPMDFLQDLKIFSVPRWTKLTVVALLGGLGMINAIVFILGMSGIPGRDEWIKSSIDLLGVLLPIFVIALIAWQANTGVHALRRVTEDFFLDLLPDVLSRTVEVDGGFYEANKGQKPQNMKTRLRF